MTTPTVSEAQVLPSASTASVNESTPSAAVSQATTLLDQSTSGASSVAAPASVASTATPAVPESYTLTLPPDAKVDAAIIERTAAIARAQGLGNEAAQSLLNGVLGEVQAQQAAQVEAWKPGGAEWKARDDAWRKETLADPEIGGSPEKLAKHVELAQQVLRKFGGEEQVKFLMDTGLGSHPAALKLLAKIGAAMSESSLVVGGGNNSSTPKSAAEKLYGPDGTGKPKTE